MTRRWVAAGSLKGEGTIAPGTTQEGTASYELGIVQEVQSHGGIGIPRTETRGLRRLSGEGTLANVTSRRVIPPHTFVLVLADGQRLDEVSRVSDRDWRITYSVPTGFVLE